jgi:hypothetical protein
MKRHLDVSIPIRLLVLITLVLYSLAKGNIKRQKKYIDVC